MSCSILKNKEGVIETVLAPNGKTSKLYQDALVVTKDKEKALRLWAIGYTPSFNKWMSNLKPEVKQEVKEEVKPGVEELFETDSNLANQVYEALGFSNNTKTQIAQIKNNNLIITQYSDESFDVVPDKEGIAKKLKEVKNY